MKNCPGKTLMPHRVGVCRLTASHIRRVMGRLLVRLVAAPAVGNPIRIPRIRFRRKNLSSHVQELV